MQMLRPSTCRNYSPCPVLTAGPFDAAGGSRAGVLTFGRLGRVGLEHVGEDAVSDLVDVG